MHRVELTISRATQIKAALISQQYCTWERQAPQFHQETSGRPRTLEPRCLEVTYPMWWFLRWILQQFYKVTAGCDLYFKAIGRSSPKGIQEKGKESADRNRLPSLNISGPFHHKTQAWWQRSKKVSRGRDWWLTPWPAASGPVTVTQQPYYTG